MKTTELKNKRLLPVEIQNRHGSENTKSLAKYRKRNEQKNHHAFVVDWQLPNE